MYKLLENRYIHNFVQRILLLGRKKALINTEREIREICSGNVLDIGCGTLRYAHLFEERYCGIDINLIYGKGSLSKRKPFVCGDATKLPFKDNSFDSVFSIGFFHHIGYDGAKNVFNEIIRVSKPDTTILIMDAFYPDSKLNLIGWLLCKIDRGRFMRRKEEFEKELNRHFHIICSLHIKRSYPYNLQAFVLKIPCA
ncbi:MAG: class I SAM-dependent methyltransferase [Deltaproteobacteria bacterium]|nr:class I SAM-dependent methyltransferase [Deltaproteobacteria bacterium]